MKHALCFLTLRWTLHRLAVAAVAVLVPATMAADAPAAKGDWTWTAGLTLKGFFDSNADLQDHGPKADRESFGVIVSPSAGATWAPGEAFRATMTYAPDVVRYFDASSEDHVFHRGALNLGGKSGDLVWECMNSLHYIDGHRLGPDFPPPDGDIPAIGGIPLRDRREALILRDGVKLTWTLDSIFLRPVFTSYIHDFRTEQHARTNAFAGYENYVDRAERNGGLDVGFKVSDPLWFVLGYRYGVQDQGKLLGASSPYDNTYHRALVGLEGRPVSWMTVNVLGGPDLRDFGSRVPARFDEGEQLFFLDAAVTVSLGKQDTVTLAARRYEQPAFSSFSMYEDIVYDVAWKHSINASWLASAGIRYYGGDWQAPVRREDWILTPSASVVWTIDKSLAIEASYLYDTVDSKVPGTEGREYTRHVATIGVKYAY